MTKYIDKGTKEMVGARHAVPCDECGDMSSVDVGAYCNTPLQRGLPEGWVWKTLGEVSEKPQYGWTTKANHETGRLKLLRTTDITAGLVDWSSVPFCTEEPKEVEKYLIKSGDILISRAGSVGVNYLINRPEHALFASYLIRFRPKPAIETKYFYYYLKSPSYWKAIGANKAGIAIPNVNASKLAQVRIPVAPLDQQKKIVAEIEKQFSRLDEAVAGLKRIKANLKRYKAAVLKAAVEGKLTEEWRKAHPNVETGAELLRRILSERKKKWEERNPGKKYKEPARPDTSNLPELPKGWVWGTLDMLLFDIQAGKSFKCKEQPPEPGEAGVVKVSAVTWGHYDENQSKTCLDRKLINSSLFVKPGDFLFSRANTIELVGACVIAQKVTKNIMLSDKILRFMLFDDLSKWVLHNLRSKLGRSEIERLATGNQQSMRNIGQDRIRAIRIPVPPFEEYSSIIEDIESRFSVTEEIETAIETNLKRAERLRQAILKKAFSGNLVSKGAEHCAADLAELPMAAEPAMPYGSSK